MSNHEVVREEFKLHLLEHQEKDNRRKALFRLFKLFGPIIIGMGIMIAGIESDRQPEDFPPSPITIAGIAVMGYGSYRGFLRHQGQEIIDTAVQFHANFEVKKEIRELQETLKNSSTNSKQT